MNAVPAHAQANTQLWGNVTFDWVKSPHLTYELDFEPKVLLSRPEGDPGWASLDVTPNAEYAWTPWLDLIGEAATGVTVQTDDVTTFELSPPWAHDYVRYLLADWEWFVPVADLEERFANRQRIRTGLGYRRNFHWRFEVIYAWTRSRETIEDDFATSDNIFNIRVKRVF
jgi:hypothetical protein